MNNKITIYPLHDGKPIVIICDEVKHIELTGVIQVIAKGNLISSFYINNVMTWQFEKLSMR